MTKKTILFIDDDETLLELLADHFRQVGFQSLKASSSEDGLKLASKFKPDIIVLDVMMPGMDGWEACKRLRKYSNVPIIMLTAKGEEVDKLHGFHLGIDDYMTKPFSFAELKARVEAILNRALSEARVGNQVISGDLTLDLDQQTVLVNGNIVDLTPTEYRLLELLANHISRTLPREMLLKEVWGPEYIDEIDHVKHYIWSLRKKIEIDPGDPKHIITERGFGYRLE